MLLCTFVVGLLFGGFSLALRSWRAAQLHWQSGGELRLGLDFMRRSLSGVVPIVEAQGSDRRVMFAGEAQDVDYMAQLPANLGQGGVYRFIVSIDGDEDHQQVGIVMEPLSDEINKPPEADPALSATVLSGLSGARLDYFGVRVNQTTGQWYDAWHEPSGLPMLIRLRFRSAGRIQSEQAVVFPLHTNPGLSTSHLLFTRDAAMGASG